MEQFKIILALYSFSLLIMFGFATSVQIVVPLYGKYAYATALFSHSIFMSYVYITTLRKVGK